MNEVVGWSHETVLAAEPVSASKARAFICDSLAAHDLDHLVEDVRLVVSELATNAVQHGRTPFVVTLGELDGFVRLAIRDGSPLPPVMSAPHLMDLGGRGLVLVEQLSHAWGSSTDGSGSKSVWATFATRHPSLPPQAN